MSEGTSHERLLAERALACEQARHAGSPDPATIAEEVLRLLRERLVLWFGDDGMHALVARATSRASMTYPLLSNVRPTPLGGRQLDRLAESASADSPEPVREALLELLSTLFALLSRLLGIDLVTRLVSQIWPEAVTPSGDIPEMRTESRE